MRDVIKTGRAHGLPIRKKKDPQQNMPQCQGPQLVEALGMQRKCKTEAGDETEEIAEDRHLVSPAVETRGGAGRRKSQLPNA